MLPLCEIIRGWSILIMAYNCNNFLTIICEKININYKKVYHAYRKVENVIPRMVTWYHQVISVSFANMFKKL